MPRKPSDYPEDTMSDDVAEDWETVSESFGTKIEWTVGARFIGEYTGTRQVEVDDKEDGLSMVDAAEFLRNGEKFYCWLPFALKQVIDSGKLTVGQTVFIECTGEESTKRGLNPVKVFTIKVKP